MLTRYCLYDDLKDLHKIVVPKVDSLEKRVINYAVELKYQLDIMKNFDSVMLTKANKAELILLKSNTMEIDDANEMESALRQDMRILGQQ